MIPTRNTQYLRAFRAIPAVIVAVLDTNERLRQRALRLIAHGVSQKVLAGKMGMKPPTFSKWLNQKGGVNPPSVNALDGIDQYVRELTQALEEEPMRQPAGAVFREEWDGVDRRSGADRRVAANDK
jgi:transcriptional regulator with XRE-family HTH domain